VYIQAISAMTAPDVVMMTAAPHIIVTIVTEHPIVPLIAVHRVVPGATVQPVTLTVASKSVVPAYLDLAEVELPEQAMIN
jgi:hypothetical protein